MWRSAGNAVALGLEIGVCLAIGVLGGHFLDRKFNTHWIMYLGLFFGLGAAIKGIMRVTKAYKREVENSGDKGGGGGAGAN